MTATNDWRVMVGEVDRLAADNARLRAALAAVLGCSVAACGPRDLDPFNQSIGAHIEAVRDRAALANDGRKT